MARDIKDLDLCHPEDTPPEQLEALAVRAEQAALDAGASMSDGASANAHFGFKVYGNTHGLLEGYSNSRYSLSAVAIAKHDQSMQRDYDYSQHRLFSQLSEPEVIGRLAAEKAKARLNGRKLATQSLPVVFHRDVAASLFGHLITAISGGSLYRKSSFLLDHLGQPIFPRHLRIEEDPWLPQGLASAPFDSEGVATEPRIIVDAGKIRNLLADQLLRKKNGHAQHRTTQAACTTGKSRTLHQPSRAAPTNGHRLVGHRNDGSRRATQSPAITHGAPRVFMSRTAKSNIRSKASPSQVI